MPTEDDLREALATGVERIPADVDAELHRVLARAADRRRTRRTAYAAGLAAAVALAALVAAHDWQPRAAEPEPARQVPVQDLVPERGRYLDPAALTPGTYRVSFLPGNWWRGITAEVDVPTGWGQDDRYALATGPAERPRTRRVDFFGGQDAVVARCSGASPGPRPSTLEVVRTVASVAAMSGSPPEPVTVDGHPGYFVELRDTPAREVSRCRRPSDLYAVPGIRSEAPGFTTLMWTFDVEGERAAVFASYGPEVTEEQVTELVDMVESASYDVGAE